MKCGIVKFSTLTKHKRWDVGFYIGDDETTKAVENAKVRLKAAQTLLENREAALIAENTRVAAFQQSGEIKVLLE